MSQTTSGRETKSQPRSNGGTLCENPRAVEGLCLTPEGRVDLRFSELGTTTDIESSGGAEEDDLECEDVVGVGVSGKGRG